jgi:hypothetical protein
MIRLMAVASVVVMLMAADAGTPPKAPHVVMHACLVLNARTGERMLVPCAVREMRPDGGVNPDGGFYRY